MRDFASACLSGPCLRKTHGGQSIKSTEYPDSTQRLCLRPPSSPSPVSRGCKRWPTPADKQKLCASGDSIAGRASYRRRTGRLVALPAALAPSSALIVVAARASRRRLRPVPASHSFLGLIATGLAALPPWSSFFFFFFFFSLVSTRHTSDAQLSSTTLSSQPSTR